MLHKTHLFNISISNWKEKVLYTVFVFLTMCDHTDNTVMVTLSSIPHQPHI